MGLKKYEIIKVGSDKRVRALRSWAVGDRYVNIGDVGGIVYDEKTLSQDGACWLFRGNFGFPGARIGGDSIVDVAETALSSTGAPNVDILGSSVVVGSKLRFETEQTVADAVVLTADDFEQGAFVYTAGGNWETGKTPSASNIRTKAPIFSGGVSATLKLEVPGYTVQAFVLDRDGIGINATAPTDTGVGVTLAIPAGRYFVMRLTKNPNGAIVPADATAAKITFTGTYETKLSIIDSRLEVGPATSTAVATIRPGGTYTIASGAKYPEAVIRNTNMSIIVPASTDRVFRLMGRITGSTATLDGTTSAGQMVGIHSNVKNLTFAGAPIFSTNVSAYSIIQATDCDNFTVSSTVFPAISAAQTANMPFIFQGCNVPNGLFYHHAQIANTYKNIDFAKAQADLGKSVPGVAYTLVSSEIEGMYRIYNTEANLLGFLVESYDSVSSLRFAADSPNSSYNTTIYKDAYLSGIFTFAGTNVFGNKARSHPLAQVLNVQPRVVQGNFNATSVGGRITAVITAPQYVSTPSPFRINGAKGLTINNLPAGCVALLLLVDQNNVITRFGSGAEALPAAALTDMKAFIRFSKSDNSPITPADLAGVTVTVYNGCKIVNTGATAVNMKGNIRVEDNAILVNASVVGSGYFGGNAVISGMAVNGYAYMKDNTLCTKTSENVQTFASLVMEGNAVYNSIASLAYTGLNVFMYDNSKVLGELRSAAPVLIMRDNATIAAAGNVSGASVGTVTIKDNAVINTSITVVGDVTLCGSYASTSVKTWAGKRVIDNHNAPEYDNNVKTQYDF